MCSRALLRSLAKREEGKRADELSMRVQSTKLVENKLTADAGHAFVRPRIAAYGIKNEKNLRSLLPSDWLCIFFFIFGLFLHRPFRKQTR